MVHWRSFRDKWLLLYTAFFFALSHRCFALELVNLTIKDFTNISWWAWTEILKRKVPPCWQDLILYPIYYSNFSNLVAKFLYWLAKPRILFTTTITNKFVLGISGLQAQLWQLFWIEIDTYNLHVSKLNNVLIIDVSSIQSWAILKDTILN